MHGKSVGGGCLWLLRPRPSLVANGSHRYGTVRPDYLTMTREGESQACQARANVVTQRPHRITAGPSLLILLDAGCFWEATVSSPPPSSDVSSGHATASSSPSSYDVCSDTTTSAVSSSTLSDSFDVAVSAVLSSTPSDFSDMATSAVSSLTLGAMDSLWGRFVSYARLYSGHAGTYLRRQPSSRLRST